MRKPLYMATLRKSAGTDPRYADVGFFLDSGRIKCFLDIFRIIPRTVVAIDFGMKSDKFVEALNDDNIFTLWHYKTMAKWMHIKKEVFIALVFDHYRMIDLGGKLDIKNFVVYDPKRRVAIDNFEHETEKKR